MGSIKSLQIAMGYRLKVPAGQPCCKTCQHQSKGLNGLSQLLPYCKLGGFMVWLDSGCARHAPRAAPGGRHD